MQSDIILFPAVRPPRARILVSASRRQAPRPKLTDPIFRNCLALLPCDGRNGAEDHQTQVERRARLELNSF
jgi:hypothetical protein